MNRTIHPPAHILLDGVTRLVGPLRHTELPPAVLEHLRHERQRVELAPLVESCQNLIALRTSTRSPARRSSVCSGATWLELIGCALGPGVSGENRMVRGSLFGERTRIA